MANHIYQDYQWSAPLQQGGAILITQLLTHREHGQLKSEEDNSDEHLSRSNINSTNLGELL